VAFFPHNVKTVNFLWIGTFWLRFVTLVALLILAPGRAAARVKPKPAQLDSDYVPALAMADRFLHAWQTQDQEDGLMMLTDSAKQQWPEERLQEFFSAGENGAYQITGGKKLKTGRYAFPVALLEEPRGGKVRRRFSEIVVMRSGSQEWAVDRLP
jgi:hypothetical protein